MDGIKQFHQLCKSSSDSAVVDTSAAILANHIVEVWCDAPDQERVIEAWKQGIPAESNTVSSHVNRTPYLICVDTLIAHVVPAGAEIVSRPYFDSSSGNAIEVTNFPDAPHEVNDFIANNEGAPGNELYSFHNYRIHFYRERNAHSKQHDLIRKFAFRRHGRINVTHVYSCTKLS